MQLADRTALLAALNTLSENGQLRFAQNGDPSYAHALGDLMQLFRLAVPIEDGVAIEGDMARLFVRSLAAHLADDVPVALPFNGPELLAAAESARRERVLHPTPVREIFAVNAIIKAGRDGHDYLLMQYDDNARQFQLIGGKREPDDVDTAHTVLREIQEELAIPALRVPADLTLVPIGERFEQTTLSPTYGVVTSYHISFYHVRNMRFRPHLDSQTRWIDLEHIRAGRLPDGRKVSDLAVQSLADCLGDLAYSADEPFPLGTFAIDE